MDTRLRRYDDSGEERGNPLSLDLPRFFRQHDRNAVADRIGEFCGPRDQFLPCCVELQRTLGHRTDQDFQKLGVDGAFKAFGRGCHDAWSPARYLGAVAYPIASYNRAASIARPSSAARRARPAVSPGAMVCPKAQSRETPSRELAHGRELHWVKARTP